jgi:N-formylglutamate amidohydrolase
VDTVAQTFTRHGFEVHRDVSGYTGGNIVATFGQPGARRVHALQIEINSALLITISREELIAHISRGGIPEKADATFVRLRQCLGEALDELPAVVAACHAAPKETRRGAH